MASGTEHRTELPSRKADLYPTPIPSRPPRTARDWLRLALFNLSFLVLLLWSHLPQLLAFPLSWIPHLWPRAIFEACNVHSKETFASSLVFIVSQFAPTTIVLTAADESIRLDELVQRDEHGEVVGFKLARRALWMSNHQMYCDWIYPWCLMSFAGVSSGIIILLKASLKWAPLVGPAMQMFRFCFVEKGRPLYESNLFSTALAIKARDEPYQCMVFPEGTLYSKLTQPRSAQYAETLGIPNAVNILLPRSTGLLYTLRSLLTVFGSDDLTFYDLTVGYAGVPARGYAQDYYSIQTVFGLGIPPPKVHFHLRKVPLEGVPVGTVRKSARARHVAEEVSEEEKGKFEEWLREQWRVKDELMGEFGERGRFDPGRQGAVEFEVRMRRKDWGMLLSVPLGLLAFYYVICRPVVGLLR